MHIRFRPLLACMLLAGTTSICHAEIIVYQVNATIVDVYDPNNVLQGSMNVGNTISGTYSFDDTVADTDPSSEFAYYDYTHLTSGGFDLSVNGESLKTDSTVPGFMHQIHIENSFSDFFHIGSWGNRPLSNGAQVHDINLDLYDDTGTALNSAVLNSTPPNPTAFMWRDLYVGGTDSTGGAYYSVMAQVDSITLSSGSSTLPPGIIEMLVNATVNDVWDPNNALNGAVVVGANLNGSYTYNTGTVDSDPNSEFGLYAHKTNSNSYGFDFNLGGLNFKTDTQQVEMLVDLYNGASGSDHYAAMSNGSNFPLPSGAQVSDISMFLLDPQGNLLSSDSLATNPPTIVVNGFNDISINGMHPNGVDPFYINLTLNSLTASEPPSLLAISPSDGIFDRQQRFDLGLILQANLAGINSMAVSVNGIELSSSQIYCMGGAPNTQNIQTMVCPDVSMLLNNGTNTVNVVMDLLDGTHITESVKWEVIGF